MVESLAPESFLDGKHGVEKSREAGSFIRLNSYTGCTRQLTSTGPTEMVLSGSMPEIFSRLAV